MAQLNIAYDELDNAARVLRQDRDTVDQVLVKTESLVHRFQQALAGPPSEALASRLAELNQHRDAVKASLGELAGILEHAAQSLRDTDQASKSFFESKTLGRGDDCLGRCTDVGWIGPNRHVVRRRSVLLPTECH